MKHYRLDGAGGLALSERDMPKPGRHDILVRMRAASLNYLDMKILHGSFPARTTGLVPLSDGAGEVVEVGPDVTRFAPGDRVISLFLPRWVAGPIPHDARAMQPGATVDGVLAEYIVVSQDAMVRAPACLDFDQAATLPCAAVTAWQLFTGPRPLVPGETVLVQGSGGVSLFALQFAKLAGARVVATTSSAERAARLRALGADIVVNYRESPDWGQVVRAETGGQGADHIIEIGEADTLEQSITAAAANAQINLIGRPVGAPHVDPATLMRALATYRRINVGSRADFEAMNRAIELHNLKPIIDRVYEFDAAADAYAAFEGRSHFGKIVIRI